MTHPAPSRRQTLGELLGDAILHLKLAEQRMDQAGGMLPGEARHRLQARTGLIRKQRRFLAKQLDQIGVSYRKEGGAYLLHPSKEDAA